MTNQEAKSIQENIASIREVAIAMMQSSDSNMIELAMILDDNALNIEFELIENFEIARESEPQVVSRSYNPISNMIETIHTTHISSVPCITSVPCYTFTFEEWREENHDAITEYIAEYPNYFTPDMTRYNMEMKLWLQGPGPTGIYNDDIIFRVRPEEE